MLVSIKEWRTMVAKGYTADELRALGFRTFPGLCQGCFSSPCECIADEKEPTNANE